MGAIVLALMFLVFVGVVYHLTISDRGPGLLRPLLKKYEARQKSEILEQAQRQQELERHRHFHNVVAPTPKLPRRFAPRMLHMPLRFAPQQKQADPIADESPHSVSCL